MTDKIIFANTYGFQNKIDQINEIVRAQQPIALAVAEHLQCDSQKLDKINGYKLCAVFCRDKKEKGGVAIFVRVDVDYKTREDLDAYSKKNEFEVVSVEIPSRNLVVTAAYRPPKSSRKSFNARVDKMLKHYNQDFQKRHVIAGDFNIDNCKNNSTQPVLKANGFKFIFTSSTHDYGACLDNFIVDFEPSKTRVMREKFDKVSDHQPIELILPSSKSKSALKSTSSLDRLFEPWMSYRTPPKPQVSDESSDDESSVDYSDSREDHNQRVSHLSSGVARMSVSTKRGGSGRGKRGK